MHPFEAHANLGITGEGVGVLIRRTTRVGQKRPDLRTLVIADIARGIGKAKAANLTQYQAGRGRGEIAGIVQRLGTQPQGATNARMLGQSCIFSSFYNLYNPS